MPHSTLVRLLISIGLVSTMLAASGTPATALTGGIQWDDLDRSLSSYAAESNFLVAEFAGNGCTTIHDRNAIEPLAIASVFKLYVLGELARQVQLGQAELDRPRHHQRQPAQHAVRRLRLGSRRDHRARPRPG